MFGTSEDASQLYTALTLTAARDVQIKSYMIGMEFISIRQNDNMAAPTGKGTADHL